MKIYTFILSACLLSACPACHEASHHFLLGGPGWDKIVIVNKNMKEIEWEHSLEKGWEYNFVAGIPDRNTLFSCSKGAKLITRDHEEVWNISAPEGCEMQTARVLSNGNYLLAWCGNPATIMEVNARGEILSKTDFDVRIEQPHAQLRQVNKNKRGNYLVPLFATSEIWEISPSNQLLKSVKVDGNPSNVAASDNGNYLVACGDARCFIELNFETRDIVRKVNASGIEGARLFFVTQLLPKRDGGLYICNWQGHDGEVAKGYYPQLIEINGVGKMVWDLNDNATFGTISSICPVDQRYIRIVNYTCTPKLQIKHGEKKHECY